MCSIPEINTRDRSRRIGLLLALLFAATFSGAGLQAQTPGTLDTAFNPNVTGYHYYVLTTVVQLDGKIVIGGGFSSLGTFPTTTRNCIARLNTDGTVDASFNPGSGANNDVNCLAIQTDGKIVVGGSFTTMNGQAYSYLCRLNSDGSLDSSFAPTIVGTAVYSVAIQPDGKILAGGLFGIVNGSFRSCLVRLNADGTLDSSFRQQAVTNDKINVVVVQPDGHILLGGVFTEEETTTANRIARLDSSGNLETTSTFNPGTGFNSDVNCITLQSDGKILVAGDFTTLNGTMSVRVARLGTNGVPDSTFNSGGAGANAVINGLALETDGKVLVAGNFTSFNGSFAYTRLARLTTSGAVDTTFGAASGPNPIAYSLALQPDGKILVGGSFDFLGSTARSCLGRLTNDTATQTLTKTSSSVVTWSRSGTPPEVWNPTFELSTDHGNTWTLLGSPSRISGGWQLTGLSLPSSGYLRARAQAVGGTNAGGSSLIEQMLALGGASTAPVATTAGATANATPNPPFSTPIYGATLNGSVNALGLSTTVSFQYGPSIGYGNTVTASQSPVGGSTLTSVSAAITNLFPNTTYHYRVTATNSSGTTNGSDATFTSLNNVATLASLGVTGATLSPPFNTSQPPGILYNAVVPANAGSATVTFTTTDSKATVNVNGTALPAGTTGTAMSLVPGNNTIPIIVTAQDGVTTSTYSLTITQTTTPTGVTAHTDVANSYAVLKASVQAMDTTATVTFQWGLDTNYGNTISGPAATGGFASLIGATLTGLAPGTTYHYRVIVTNSQGSVTSSDATFTTDLVAPPGSIDSSFTSSTTLTVDTTAFQADGRILVGGFFSKVNGVVDKDIARLNTDGTLDTNFNASTNFAVTCMAVQTSGQIVIGGNFSTVDNVSVKGLARLNADGSLDNTFSAATNNSSTSALALQPDGKILVGGSFTTIGGVTQKYLARLNSDGSLDNSFAPVLDFLVNSIAVQTDGKIVIGGSFSNAGGVAHKNIARLNADGTVDSSFTASTDFQVDCVVVQPNGAILLGGDFGTVNSTTRNHIARLNADSSLDTSFDPEASGEVATLSLQADGKILAGGSFTSIAGTPRNYIARLYVDGTLDTAFDPDAGSQVTSVATAANGEVLVGGAFNTMFGQTHQSLALLVNDAASQSLTVPDLTQVQWARSGTVPEVNSVAFQLSTDGGMTWGALGYGTRVSGGWQLTGLSLPSSGLVQAIGITTSGESSGSSGLIEQTWSYPPAPQISIEQPAGTVLTSGTSTVDFGQLLAGASSSKTFTVRNPGNADLTNLSITFDGSNPGDFQVTTPPASDVTGGGSTTFTVQFTAGAVGARSATLHLASNVTGSSPFNIGLTGAGLTQLENWRLTWFGFTTDTGNAADDADPDGDGVPNLLEFATGSNPTVANAAPGQVVLNGSNLEFTYQRTDAALADGIAFVVEWSDTLLANSWSNSGVNETILSDDGTTQQVKAILPAGPDGQRFVHLRVTH